VMLVDLLHCGLYGLRRKAHLAWFRTVLDTEHIIVTYY
jgi:hypothetical protein